MTNERERAGEPLRGICKTAHAQRRQTLQGSHRAARPAAGHAAEIPPGNKSSRLWSPAGHQVHPADGEIPGRGGTGKWTGLS